MLKRWPLFVHLTMYCILISILIVACGCSEDNEPKGSSVIKGTVESFVKSTVLVARLVAVASGITVYLDGPVSRKATTDENGTFIFSNLPSGQYSLRFEHNGEEVTYKGNSGQDAKVTLEDDQEVELSGVEVRGGNVNVGNIGISDLNDPTEPIEDEPEPETEPKPLPKILPAVKLLSPTDGSELRSVPYLDVELRWQKVNGAVSYRVTIIDLWIECEDDTGTGGPPCIEVGRSWRTYLQADVSDTKLTVDLYTMSKWSYRWYVQALDEYGNCGEKSEYWSIDVN